MHPKKKCSHAQKEYKGHPDSRPLQPADPVEPGELGDPTMSISLIMISNSLILSSVASGIVLYNNYSYRVESLKIYEAKRSKWINLYKTYENI
jgi:hypothetical protein